MDNNSFDLKSESADIRLEAPTFIDPLTGLFNRYYLHQFLPEEIKKATLNNYPVSLLMIDLDGYKKINDTYGHLCGDKVLTQVSEIIKKVVRQTDTVIRYAGDEFIVILPGASREKTPSLCDRLLQDIEKSVLTGDKNQQLHLTLSIGFAIYPEDAGEQIKLIDMADKALYLSKKRGRNRYSSAKEVTVEEVSSLVAMDSFPCRELIDQQEALNKIRQVFDIVIKSNLLQAVFISGSGGVGKSRILSEIRTYLKDQGGHIYCNSSSPHMQDPYYLFAKGIGAYMDTMGIDNSRVTDILLKAPLLELSELSLIIPQFRSIVKKPMDLGVDDKKRRFLLFKAFVDFLIELNKISCVLIIFDDIHWADKASLELLRYLIKQERNMRVFIICAFSADKLLEATGGDNLQDLLKEIAGSDNVTKIELENLSLEHTSKMVETMFPGVGTSGELAHLFYDITKGNPSFIEELLKSLVEKGVIFYQDNSWQIKQAITNKDIPTSMEEIVKGRLKNLDDETKEMIVQAAIIGDNFQMDTLKRIGDKDEGLVTELINRAKKMRFIDESGAGGRFSFINKNTQNILYRELNEDQRNKIHYKIGQILASQHRDNLYDVAGEVAFHLSQASQQKAVEFSKELLEKTSELFNPNEVTGYLEQLAQEIFAPKEKIVVELSDRMMKEATKVIIFLQGAVKKFRLYPIASSVRQDTVKEIYPVLNKIFNETENFTISEVEKSLVINGSRLSPSEVEYTNAEQFLTIMMEQNIKTISFKKGLREDELNNFIHHLSLARKDIIVKGGWIGVINKEGLQHIGIDDVRFTSVSEYTTKAEEKKKLQDAMLMEFLLGKVDHTAVNKEEFIYNLVKNPKEIAKTITDITDIITEKDKTTDKAKVATDVITKINSQILSEGPKGHEHAEDLSKVILELEPELRNKVISYISSDTRQENKKIANDIIGAISDDYMVDMIIETYKNNIDNPLIVKELIDGILLKEERKKRILKKMESRLSGLNISKQDIAFVTEQIRWEDLPIDRRIDMLLKLPQDNYSISVLGKINNILRELDSAGKKEGLKNSLSRLLIKTEQINGKVRKDLLGIIADFIEEPFVSKKEDRLRIANRIDYILEKLDIETDPVIFAHILEFIEEIIGDFMNTLPESKDIILGTENSVTKRYYLFIDQIFYSLLKRFKIEEDRHSQICELIRSFILDISSTPFLEMLVYRIVDDPTKSKYDIRDIYRIIGDKIIDILINLATKKPIDLKDPFREFLVKKRISNLLMDLKDASSERLRKILSDMKDEVPTPLIELVGYLKNDELIDLLLPFVKHRDSVMRIATILALSGIGGKKSIEILSKIVKEEQDNKIRDLANVRLQKLKGEIPL